MSYRFAKSLKDIRQASGLSQQQLAELVFVSRSTVTNWETGRRIPDAIMIRRLADVLNVEAGTLLGMTEPSPDSREVIIVDDEEIILTGEIEMLEEAFDKSMPQSTITGFIDPVEALQYAQSNRIDFAFCDIEMGPVSGLDVCRQLLEINSHTNVAFLTAHKQYAFDAWEVGACGFLLKPLAVEDIDKLLRRLDPDLFSSKDSK